MPFGFHTAMIWVWLERVALHQGKKGRGKREGRPRTPLMTTFPLQYPSWLSSSEPKTPMQWLLCQHNSLITDRKTLPGLPSDIVFLVIDTSFSQAASTEEKVLLRPHQQPQDTFTILPEHLRNHYLSWVYPEGAKSRTSTFLHVCIPTLMSTHLEPLELPLENRRSKSPAMGPEEKYDLDIVCSRFTGSHFWRAPRYLSSSSMPLKGRSFLQGM